MAVLQPVRLVELSCHPAQTNIQELVNTALLAAVGATAGYIMCLLLKYLAGQFHHK